jgi:oligopeptidase A
MAHNGSTALAFLEELDLKTRSFFDKENTELERFRRDTGDTQPMQAWDIAYWAEKLRKALYDLDEEMLRPYFPMERVISGMFDVVQRLYGIRVSRKEGVPAWHPDVAFYEIFDRNGAPVGAFYADWFPRENKRGGAWMDAFWTGRPTADGFTAHLGLMCGNMNPPSAGKPALLTHRDVETVFHEFGHLLHHCLTRVEVRSLAGTSVPWDFVELPSQIMENWCWEREALDLFARHYHTGEPLPEALFTRMRNARTFRAANAMMRQLSFGIADLLLHRVYNPELHGDVIAWSREILNRFSPVPLPEDHAVMASFTHLFSSPVAYAAGYYSYKWAEVLDADAFTAFQADGIFNAETGARFRNQILAKGDSDDPAQLYRNFLGRDPNPQALLARAGLT